MSTSVRLAIIAAMKREIAPLVKGWNRDRKISAAHLCYRRGDTVVMCGGIGKDAAVTAARALLDAVKPELLVSAGLAGALVSDYCVGQIMVPAVVLNTRGLRVTTGVGSGTLISSNGVAGPEAKRLLARQFNAHAADMEAAGIAQVAQGRGVPFMAIKAISDSMNFPMPELDRYISPRGSFRIWRFVFHNLGHPENWKLVLDLNSNTKRACKELCKSLRTLIREGVIGEERPLRGSAKPLVSNQ